MGTVKTRLKELKEDFGADGYCLDSFDGTEAALRLVCFLYNLMALFKREVLLDDKPRLETVRTAVLVVGAILGRERRTPVLRLGLRERWRDRFSTLLERIAAIKPTVAQLDSSVERMEVRPWKARVRRSYPRRVSAAA